jgi:glutamine phosphoribosylpyrophosphate amidotransferase
MTAPTRDRSAHAEADPCKRFFTNTVLTGVVYGVDVVRSAESNRFMCGIAGFSLRSDSPVDRTLAAQALLAGIAERGADAVGYAHRGDGGSVGVTKLLGGASALLDELAVPAAARQVLIHVRDYTKGHPEIQANNHPIRHGSVVGIHNGVIQNDDALLARYGIDRAEPQMTVDSEAIFALMELRRNDARTLSEMRGAMAAAWVDERDDATLFLARGRLRPLWLGGTNDGLYFASTRRALTIAAAALRTRLDIREVREGRLLHVVDGRVVRERRFRPDRRYRENGYLPPVRAPREAVSCLERLAALTSVSTA